MTESPGAPAPNGPDIPDVGPSPEIPPGPPDVGPPPEPTQPPVHRDEAR